MLELTKLSPTNPYSQILNQVHRFYDYAHRFVLPKDVTESAARGMCDDLRRNLATCWSIECFQEEGRIVITAKRKDKDHHINAKADRSPTDWEIEKAQEICRYLMAGAPSDPAKKTCLQWKTVHGEQLTCCKSPYVVATLLNAMDIGMQFEGKMNTAYGLGANDLAVVIVRK